MDSFPAHRGLTSPPHMAEGGAGLAGPGQASPLLIFRRGELPGWEKLSWLRSSVPPHQLPGEACRFRAPWQPGPRADLSSRTVGRMQGRTSWEPPWVFSPGKICWRLFTSEDLKTNAPGSEGQFWADMRETSALSTGKYPKDTRRGKGTEPQLRLLEHSLCSCPCLCCLV